MEIREIFRCDDDTLEIVLATLSNGRNIHRRHCEYRCGWRIVDERTRDDNGVSEYSFFGNVNEIIALQMIPGVEL